MWGKEGGNVYSLLHPALLFIFDLHLINLPSFLLPRCQDFKFNQQALRDVFPLKRLFLVHKTGFNSRLFPLRRLRQSIYPATFQSNTCRIHSAEYLKQPVASRETFPPLLIHQLCWWRRILSKYVFKVGVPFLSDLKFLQSSVLSTKVCCRGKKRLCSQGVKSSSSFRHFVRRRRPSNKLDGTRTRQGGKVPNDKKIPEFTPTFSFFSFFLSKTDIFSPHSELRW